MEENLIVEDLDNFVLDIEKGKIVLNSVTYFPNYKKIFFLVTRSSCITIYDFESRKIEKISLSSKIENLEISDGYEGELLFKCNENTIIFCCGKVLLIYSADNGLLEKTVVISSLSRSINKILSIFKIREDLFVCGTKFQELALLRPFEETKNVFKILNTLPDLVYKEGESRVIPSKKNPNCIFLNTFETGGVIFVYNFIIFMIDIKMGKVKKRILLKERGRGEHEIRGTTSYLNKRSGSEILIISSNISIARKKNATPFSLHFFDVDSTKLIKFITWENIFENSTISFLSERQCNDAMLPIFCSEKNSYLYLGWINHVVVVDLINDFFVNVYKFDLDVVDCLVPITERGEFVFSKRNGRSLRSLRIMGLRCTDGLEESDLKERIFYLLNEMEGEIRDENLRVNLEMKNNISLKDIPKILFY